MTRFLFKNTTTPEESSQFYSMENYRRLLMLIQPVNLEANVANHLPPKQPAAKSNAIPLKKP